jgi:hypothetical protein
MILEKVKLVPDLHGLDAFESEAGSTPTSELAAAKIDCDLSQRSREIYGGIE